MNVMDVARIIVGISTILIGIYLYALFVYENPKDKSEELGESIMNRGLPLSIIYLGLFIIV